MSKYKNLVERILRNENMNDKFTFSQQNPQQPTAIPL